MKRKEQQTEITTTSVMFVENTPHGELCARLQRTADRMACVAGRRVKMVEMGGTSLGQTFSNRNPWAGAGCERSDCHTCHQGGNADKREDCFKRNILYESRCGTCEDRRAETEPNMKRKRKDNFEEPNIYVGESSRSLYERTREHIKDGRDKTEDSHIAKHWEQEHEGEDMPEFRFRIIRSFRDSLSRQVAESIRIDLRGEQVLNSKTVYSRNRLPRLGIEKPEWEREAEERWTRAAEAKKKEEEMDKQRAALGEGQAVLDEVMMTEHWRIRQCEDRCREDQQDHRPSKRQKRAAEITWGLVEETEDQVNVREWLMFEKTPSTTRERRQSLLRPWTWLQMEARKIIIEIANKVEADRIKKSENDGSLMLGEQQPILSDHKSRDDDSKVVMSVKEQNITSLWNRQRIKLLDEQSRLQRILIGERKRAELIEKVTLEMA